MSEKEPQQKKKFLQTIPHIWLKRIRTGLFIFQIAVFMAGFKVITSELSGHHSHSPHKSTAVEWIILFLIVGLFVASFCVIGKINKILKDSDK